MRSRENTEAGPHSQYFMHLHTNPDWAGMHARALGPCTVVGREGGGGGIVGWGAGTCWVGVLREPHFQCSALPNRSLRKQNTAYGCSHPLLAWYQALKASVCPRRRRRRFVRSITSNAPHQGMQRRRHTIRQPPTPVPPLRYSSVHRLIINFLPGTPRASKLYGASCAVQAGRCKLYECSLAHVSGAEKRGGGGRGACRSATPTRSKRERAMRVLGGHGGVVVHVRRRERPGGTVDLPLQVLRHVVRQRAQRQVQGMQRVHLRPPAAGTQRRPPPPLPRTAPPRCSAGTAARPACRAKLSFANAQRSLPNTATKEWHRLADHLS